MVAGDPRRLARDSQKTNANPSADQLKPGLVNYELIFHKPILPQGVGQILSNLIKNEMHPGLLLSRTGESMNSSQSH
jgi:hypothetical protein